MAHFAKVNTSNNKVEQVIVVDNNQILDSDGNESEDVGKDYIANVLKLDGEWKQTSYNTRENKYYNEDMTLGDDQSKAFRYNFAEINGKWNEEVQGFETRKWHNGWVLNPDTLNWDAPVDPPSLTQEEIDAGITYIWNETDIQWDRYDPSE
tara:strand:+ start:7358 stop:7810 length:453 start_codon:yes stop_codon:yes gene_type:complete